MKDLYLKSTSKDQLIADLEKVSSDFIDIDEDGVVLFKSGFGFALHYCGILQIPGSGRVDSEDNILEPVEYYDGVHCNVRLWNEYENIFDGFSSEFTELVFPKTPCIIFGKLS